MEREVEKREKNRDNNEFTARAIPAARSRGPRPSDRSHFHEWAPAPPRPIPRPGRTLRGNLHEPDTFQKATWRAILCRASPRIRRRGDHPKRPV